MASKTLIKTSGRTGSHLILFDYQQMGYTKKYSTDKELFWEMEYTWAKGFRYVVQEHKILGFPDDITDWDLIYNYREDITSQITSSLIAKATGVWRGTQNISTKLVFSDEEIKDEVMIHLIYKEVMDRAYKWNWKSRKRISMERLLYLNNDYSHLDRHKSIAYGDAIDNIDEHTVRVIESIIANEELAKAWGTIAFDMYEGGKNYV
jgi:hypothetical protein